MIEKHRAQLRALSDEDLDVVAEVTGCAGEPLLVEALEERGLVQADVVYALLRAEHPRAPAALGRLVNLVRETFARPWPRPLPAPPPRVADPDDRWVAGLGRQEGAPRGTYRWLQLPAGAAGRWRDRDRARPRSVRVRLGMTVRELVAAGVPREEVEAARRAGRLRLSTERRPPGRGVPVREHEEART